MREKRELRLPFFFPEPPVHFWKVAIASHPVH